MKYRCLTTAILALAFAASSRGGERTLSVVATTADLGAIAREIGGGHADVSVLAKPTEDPHFVDAKPSHITRLARADMLIEGGAELEAGWLPPLLDGARNPRLEAGRPGRVSCAEGLALRDVPPVLDRSRGDVHAMGNPHFMTDPLGGRHAAGRIAAAYAAVDPANATAYAERLRAFAARLDARMADWQRRLAPFRGRRVVAYHNSWPYFADRFGLRIDLFLEPKPGIPPTPAHLAEVVAAMKAEGIGAIIIEPYENRRTAEMVSAKTGAAIVEFAQYPGGVKGTESGYVELCDYLVNALAEALGRAPTAPELKP